MLNPTVSKTRPKERSEGFEVIIGQNFEKTFATRNNVKESPTTVATCMGKGIEDGCPAFYERDGEEEVATPERSSREVGTTQSMRRQQGQGGHNTVNVPKEID